MKKILLTIILTFQIGIIVAQKNQSELIIGTWRFEKECDLRTDKEKSEFVNVAIDPIETENGTGYSDRTFKENGEFEFYYNSDHTNIGTYRIENDKLIIERRLSKEIAKNRKEAVDLHLKRKLMIKKKDGFYYFKPLGLDLKSVSDNRIEFGTEKHYTIWKRIK
ncbi:lipocalin family protein [uncultured Tenacibaculum sp.]|uniref:lipocalin family protein n=1 Tax=uncultured Tenacibaculum sp. TaxID=174713 RepID=UPI0026317A13|nr:lipocalin family protein [uncultured Tenacibaculum sp.]